MKRTFNALLILSLIASGSYYLYTSNQGFKKSVNDLLQPYKPHNTDSSATKQENQKKHNATEPKVPKQVRPDRFTALDLHARNTPRRYTSDIQGLANYLMKPAKSDIEKVRVLFTWVASHIKYDDEAFNSERYPDYSAENVLSTRRAVCEGYSNLLEALCQAAGLKAEKVIGYAKGYGYKAGDKFKETDHAWNAVEVDNTWRLFDVTWASGFGTNQKGKMVSTLKYEPFWFDVDPKAFIFTHLPQEPKWQLTGSKLTLHEYEKLPYLGEGFFKLGFKPDNIYKDAVDRKMKAFAETFPTDFPIIAAQSPYSQYLIRNEELTFELQSEYADQIALIDDNSWHYFLKKNNTFTLSHRPAGRTIKICIKINSFDKAFNTILKYKVIDKETLVASNGV